LVWHGSFALPFSGEGLVWHGIQGSFALMRDDFGLVGGHAMIVVRGLLRDTSLRERLEGMVWFGC
jgi:hypothetical protein